MAGALERIGSRIREAVETRTGMEVVARDQMQVLESAEGERRVLRKTLDWIGWTLLNQPGQQVGMLGQMPGDMLPIARVAAAAMSQRAWVEDPMAGQAVDLYVSFVFGRGVPRAQAHDDEVQDVLDACWDDEANKRVFSSFERLIEKGIDLCLQANVFFVLFDDGQDGAVRSSLLTFADVQQEVRHPKDKLRILYYRCLERPLRYDYVNGCYVAPVGEAGKPKTVYYEALGAFDDDNAVMKAQDEMAGGRAALAPPAAMLRPGKVVHLAVNKTSEMAFGVPRMRRMLRWWTAYNEVLESHVNRMKAMASIYMKFTAKGAGNRDLERIGRMATGRASRLGETGEHGGGPFHGRQGTGALGANDAVDFEPFKIDSGASDVAASIPQLRAQISGVFPPTYFGQDAGALAGSQTVELPVLKFIERDQETWATMLRAFASRAVDRAVEVGDLTEWRDPTVDEQEQIELAEETGDPLHFEVGKDGKIKRDLGFDLSLPSPLKRAMTDLVTAATTTATAVDPNGDNPELTRWLFGFILAEAFDVEDPQRIVDQVFPRKPAQDQQPDIDPATGLPRQDPAAGSEDQLGADGQMHPPDNAYGAKQTAPNPEDRPPAGAGAVQETVATTTSRGRRRAQMHATASRDADVEQAFREVVTDFADDALTALGHLPDPEG